MLKRTKGYVLLTMLVLTGLAGRIHIDTLRTKERNLLVNEIKSQRASLLSEIKDLSVKQMNFQVNGRSIRKIIHDEVNYETNIWMACKNQVAKQVVILSNNHAVSDREFENILQSGQIEFDVPSAYHSDIKSSKTEIAKLKNLKDEELKFARTTTDNLHRYILQTNCGSLDVYQVLLLTATYSNICLQQIKSIESAVNFPN